MKYLPGDLNPWVKYFALYIVFMEYGAAGTNPTNYTAKVLGASTGVLISP